MKTKTNSDNGGAYEVQCTNGVCTAKLKVSLRRAYAVPAERGAALARALNLPALPAEITARRGEGPYLGLGSSAVTREIDRQKRTVLFVASDESEDRYGDIIRASGWQLENFRKNPVGLWCHDSNGMCSAHTGMPMAAGRAWVDGPKLMWLAEFWPEGRYEFSDLVFDAYALGKMNAVSVGFIPDEFKWIEGGEGIEFLKQELLEVSFVPLPANPNALVVEDSFGKYAPAVRAIEIEGRVAVGEGTEGGRARTESAPDERVRPSEQLKQFCDEGRQLVADFRTRIDGLRQDVKEFREGAMEKLDGIAGAQTSVAVEAAPEKREPEDKPTDEPCPKGEDCPKEEGMDDCPMGDECPMKKAAPVAVVAAGQPRQGRWQVRASKMGWTRSGFTAWLKRCSLQSGLLPAETDADFHVAEQHGERRDLRDLPDGLELSGPCACAKTAEAAPCPFVAVEAELREPWERLAGELKKPDAT